MAWGIEVTLLTTSVVTPLYIGSYLNQRVDVTKTEVSPTLQFVQTKAAKAFGLPPRSLPTQVTPLTNVLWTASLGLPLVLAAAHIYSVSRYGRSWPKQWMGVQVLTLEGQMPGLGRTLLREAVGKGATPLLVAYGIWHVSGAFPVVSILVGLGAITIVGESLTALGNRPRRAYHDWLAGTCLVDRGTGAMIRLASLWEAEAQPQTWQRGIDWLQSVGPQAVIFNPRHHEGIDTELTPKKLGLALGTLLTVGGLMGVGSYWVAGQSQSNANEPNSFLYTDLVSTLTNPELDPAARRAAVLALGNLPDERVTPLLVDLIAQTDDPLWLDALQQALVARGAAAFPPLRRLNQSLAADLAMQNNPDLHSTMIVRLQTVNRILTKLIVLETGDRTATIDFSHMHLGAIDGSQGDFRLVLKNQDLSNIHWPGAVLTEAQFQGATFYHPGPDNHTNTYDDRMTDFSGANLTDADFAGANLTLSRWVNAGLVRTNFNRADLTLADLHGANLEQASFIQTILEQANLAEARLAKADFTEAQLQAADLTGARFAEVNASGVQLFQADLQGIVARAAKLPDANLSYANLQDGDFTSSSLQGATLRNANLANATFRDADLRGVWLQGAILTDADLAGAILTDQTLPASDGFVEAVPQMETGNQYASVDFSHVRNLDSQQLTYICAQGGLHPTCGTLMPPSLDD
jgi:uncharacterized protein YjbI with pentapeptide repeats